MADPGRMRLKLLRTVGWQVKAAAIRKHYIAGYDVDLPGTTAFALDHVFRADREAFRETSRPHDTLRH
jgi:hypothetical protein